VTSFASGTTLTGNATLLAQFEALYTSSPTTTGLTNALQRPGGGNQRARAETQYRSARTAIRQMIGRLDDPRFTLPSSLGFRRQFLEDALAFYDGAIRDDASADPLARIDKVVALMEADHYQIMIEKADDAVQSFRRALSLLQALEAEGISNPENARLSIEGLTKLALALTAAGRLEESATTHRQSIERAEQAEARSIPLSGLLAWSHHNLGYTLLNLGRAGEAEPHFAQSVHLRRSLLASEPEEFDLESRPRPPSRSGSRSPGRGPENRRRIASLVGA
jgi:tetratricopeptide (TPR) repeat protein